MEVTPRQRGRGRPRKGEIVSPRAYTYKKKTVVSKGPTLPMNPPPALLKQWPFATDSVKVLR
jgi:hypothetical protein